MSRVLALADCLPGWSMFRLGMDLIEASPDDLTDSLAFALLRQRKALQRFAMRPGHEPGMEDCQAIAKELVEHLKRTGVEKIIRRQSTSHRFS